MMTNCPICGRELSGDFIQEHHLIPRTFKGRDVIRLHKACHQKLHATFSEREMKNYFHTIERILESEQIQSFIKWISSKPIDFYDKSEETHSRKNKRKK